MSASINLSNTDLISIIGSITKNPKHFNSGKNLLELARRMYVSDYKNNQKTIDLETQNNFVKDILPRKKSVIREYVERFNNDLITENEKGVGYINEFFEFLKENAVPLHEAAATPDQILQGLHKAFDGVGTDENLAMTTILKIGSKQVLDQVNAKIAATVGKKYPKIQNLAAWINDEMSELDPKEYDKIWGHLAKMGYRGKESNKFLRALGKTGQWIGEKWEWTKKNVIGSFFNKLRDALNSGWGVAATLLLDYLGPYTLGISAAIPMVVWGMVFQWDMLNMVTGSPEWLNIIFDTLSLLTAGALSGTLAPFSKAAKGASFNTISKAFSWLSKTKFGQAIANFLPKLKGFLGSAGGAIEKGVEWVSTKFVKLIGPEMAAALKSAASKGKQWLTGFVDSIIQWFGKQTSKAAAAEAKLTLAQRAVNFIGSKITTPSFLATEVGQTFIEKGLKPATVELVDKYVVSLGKDYGLDKTASIVDKKFGTIYGDLIRLGGAAEDLSGNKNKLLASIHNFDSKDADKLVKSFKKISKNTKKTTTSVAQTNKAKNMVVGDVKNIRPGGKSDQNQYKNVNGNFYFAGKNEKIPKWRPITNLKLNQYVAKYIFPQTDGYAYVNQTTDGRQKLVGQG